MEINKSRQVKSVAFSGHQHKVTDTGAQAYHLNCIYDANKFNCEAQFFNVSMDKKGNYFIAKGPDGSMEPFFTTNVPTGGVIVEPRYDLDLEDTQPFAYRMVLKDKTTGQIMEYSREDDSNADGCCIVTRNGSTVTKQGPMYLGIADTFAPGYVYAGFQDKNTGEVLIPSDKEKKEIAKKVRATNRTFGTVNGGTMAGFEAKIPDMAEAGCKRLITTPLQGGANMAADKYWAENNMLPAGGIGNRNNLASLQRKAFQYGMNLVDDGTFTSEGLQGIHIQRAIKWMDNDDKPDEFYYFRMNGLKDGALGMGVVPENYENMSCKIVNAPFDIVPKKDGTYDLPKNKAYDPERPTYFQVFDKTMATEEQIKDKKNIFNSYGKTTPDGNKLAINNHDDTVIPYYFEVNPTELKKNFENLNEFNSSCNEVHKITYDSPKGTMFISEFSGLKIQPKTEGGFVCWNANTDIAKYNYFASNYDTELLSDIKNPKERDIEYNNLRRANCQLQDMACNVARYRTANVRNNITEYTAKTIGLIPNDADETFAKINHILDGQDPEKPELPEDVRISKQVIQNVLDDNYEIAPKYDTYDDALVSSLMDLPLESIEFSPDVQGAMSSPYLSKLSPDSDHIGLTRFEAMNDSSYKVPQKYSKTYNKMNEVFAQDIKSFADKVLIEVNKHSEEKIFDSRGELTEYGQYLVPLVGQDIARYAITKSLMPSAKAKLLKDGEITYDYEDMTKRGTLAHMSISGDSQKDEANQIVNRIQKGVNRLGNDNVKFVAESINKRFVNTNANTLKLAEVMVSRSGLGLDWRFDAAKDVADYDSVNNASQTSETARKNNIKFWSNMQKVIKSENPNSYTVAEITDVDNYFVDTLLSQAGITSEANYSYFYSGITNLFSYDNESGDDKVGDSDTERVKQLEEALTKFANKPLEYKRNSYTFASNHDKPRMIHCMSMDMGLFNSDLSNVDNKEYRKTAYKMMNDKMVDSDLNDYDWDMINNDKTYFNNVSAKSIANAELLRNSIGYVKEKMHYEECQRIKSMDISDSEKQKKYDEADAKYNNLYVMMSKSVADIVNGDYYRNKSEDKHSGHTPDSNKKVNEKDGFGVKPVPDAFDIIYDQAVHKNGGKKILNDKELLEFRNRVDSKATEVGRAKTRIIMRYLGALSGNPTLYAGDELGMTGYDDKCGNTYLQDRGPLDWSQVEEIKDKDGKNINENYRQDIADYRQEILDIFRARKDDDMKRAEAVNNGTMYKLNKQGGSGHECSAVLYQAANGVMNLSLFNPNGIHTSPKTPVDQLHPTYMELDKIGLNGPNGKITITPGTEFKNINAKDDSVYKVHEHNGHYFIKREGGNIELKEETAPDGVMMLYHIPKDLETERETKITKKREYYNTIHNIPQTNAYDNVGKPDSKKGKNIDLTSK